MTVRNDGFRHFKTETNTTSGISYAINNKYDLHGNRLKVIHPDSSVYFTYQYDFLDRLTYVKEKGTVNLGTITYNIFGREIDMHRDSNGANTSFNYDGISRLSGIKDNFTGSGDDNLFTYLHNPASQIVELNIGNTNFHHTGNTGDIGEYHVNGLNQYTCVGSVSQSNCNAGKATLYDDNGNLVNHGSAI